jgi:SAM-dependent methyltransferase
MSDRSHGYNVSVEYKSYGFYREMAPDWLDFCVRLAGYEARRGGDAFRYLYLGSGQGFGLCVLAAANPGAEFVGVDFQPEHIAHSQSLAQAAGLSNVRFVEADFADLAAEWPRDFGTFDYVALHGVLSWISPRLRELVTQCLFHATRPGSLVYTGYSAQPAWISTIPFQHISRLIHGAAEKSPAAVLEESTDLFDRLAASNAPIFQILPALKGRVDAVKSRDPSYFAHEYLNENWYPLWHSDVSGGFRSAKLDYVGSATLADSLLPEILQPPLRQAIAEQPNVDLREDVQDLVVNQGFRRDIFCRDARPRSGGGLRANADTLLHVVPSIAPGTPVNFQTSIGDVAMEYRIFGPFIEYLADGPKPVGELMEIPNRSEMKTEYILRLLLHATILAVGAAAPADAEESQRLNGAVARAASAGAPYRALAAAKIGSGVTVSDIDLMLLDSWLEADRKDDARSLAKAVSDRLERLGRSAQASTQLQAQATTFTERTVPRYRQLGVLE